MLARARESGLKRILAIGSGTGPGTYDCALKIAEQHDWIFASTGLHPHEANVATDADYAEMERLAKHPKLIAWGEIGLDYFYDHSPREVQQRVFRDQMELAAKAKLPIIIHCRDAWADCLYVLKQIWRPTEIGGVLHCFTSTLEDAKRGLGMGFLIS